MVFRRHCQRPRPLDIIQPIEETTVFRERTTEKNIRNVSVWVDKSGHYSPAGCVNHSIRVVCIDNLVGRPDGGNHLVVNRDCTTVQDSTITILCHYSSVGHHKIGHRHDLCAIVAVDPVVVRHCSNLADRSICLYIMPVSL